MNLRVILSSDELRLGGWGEVGLIRGTLDVRTDVNTWVEVEPKVNENEDVVGRKEGVVDSAVDIADGIGVDVADGLRVGVNDVVGVGGVICATRITSSRSFNALS